jgi:hypothetical protein
VEVPPVTVRSDAAATAVAAAGGTPLRGDLTDLDSLRGGVGQADGAINLACTHPNLIDDLAAGDYPGLG